MISFSVLNRTVFNFKRFLPEKSRRFCWSFKEGSKTQWVKIGCSEPMGDQRREASLTPIKEPPVFLDKTFLDFKWLAMFPWFFMFDSRWLMIHFQFWTETECVWQSIRIENDFRPNISTGFFVLQCIKLRNWVWRLV